MRLRTILVLLVLLALAGAAYHFSARGPPGPRDGAGPAPVGKDFVDAPTTVKDLEDGEAAPAQPPSEGTMLTGRVVRRGEAPELPAMPVEGVLVRLSAGAELPPREVRTSIDGRFEHPGVRPATRLLLEVDDPSSAYFAVTFELPEIEEAVRDLGDISLEPAHVLRVIVLDERRKPIDEARVVMELDETLRKALDGLGARDRGRELEAAGGGEFALERVPPGEQRVNITAPGFVPATEIEELPQKKPLEIRLQRGWRVTGRVLTFAQAPIPGAQVLSRIWADSPDRESMTMTDDEGRFELDNLEVSNWQELELAAKATGFCDNVKGVVDGVDYIEFLLLRETVVTGRVVSEEEETPLPGAEVLLDSKEAIVAGFSAETDAQGLFEVKKVLPGEYRLEVHHSGFLPAVLPVSALAEGTRIEGVLVKLRRGLTLRGRLVSAATGAAIPGAKIRVHEEVAGDGPNVDRGTDSGLDGAFIVEGLAEGECTLTAVAPGYLKGTTDHEVLDGATEDVQVALEEGGVLEGRALGPAGEPVAGAKVFLTPDTEEWWRDPARVTGADGQYRFSGLDDSSQYTLQASHASFPTVEIRPIERGAGGDPARIDIRFAPPATIRGRVLDAGGAGVFRADVSAIRRLVDDNGYESIRGETTDETGAFALELLPAGAYDIDASFPGRMGSESKRLTLAEGQTIEGLDITLPAGLRIQGRVVDSTGRGVGGTAIRAFSNVEEVESMSEEDGRFVMEGFAPGELLLYADKGGFLGARAWATAPGAEVLLRMEPLARVSGRLAVRGRQVLQGGRVEYWLARDMSEIDAKSAAADNLGRFNFAVPAGRCTIATVVEGFGRAVLRLDLAPGERREVVLQLEPGGVVKGLVVIRERGEPVSGCDVRLEPVASGRGDDTTTRTWSDSNGRFTLDDVPAGTYTVVADNSNHAATRMEGIVVLPDQTTVVRVEVDRGQGIRGHVTKDGEPVDGARITVRKVDGRVEHTVTSHSSGGFEAAGLPAGEYEVLCIAEGILEPRRRKAALEEGSFDRVDFKLGVALLGGRVTADGKPVPGATVSVELVSLHDDDGESHTDDSGEYAIDLPVAGEYRFTVRKEEELQAGFITLPPGTTELRRDFEVGAR